MGPVMQQFGLPAEVTAAANTGDMQAFFKALENTAEPNKSDTNKKDEDKKKDDKPQDDKGDKKEDPAMSLDWFLLIYPNETIFEVLAKIIIIVSLCYVNYTCWSTIYYISI